MNFPIRSPRHATSGVFVFARILDKIRLHAEGRLPEGYTIGPIPGKRTFDDRVCCFLGVAYENLTVRTLEGGTDEEILEWCYQNGQAPEEERLEIWNAFMTKRGWRDPASLGLIKQKEEAGLGGREDIMTFFDLMDAEEGRS